MAEAELERSEELDCTALAAVVELALALAAVVELEQSDHWAAYIEQPAVVAASEVEPVPALLQRIVAEVVVEAEFELVVIAFVGAVFGAFDAGDS